MKPERWREVEQLYHAALARAASERRTFLLEACAGDEALRQEIDSLLAHERTADGFFSVPAVEVAAELMAEDSRSEPPAIPSGDALGAGVLQPGVTLGKYIIERRLG